MVKIKKGLKMKIFGKELTAEEFEEYRFNTIKINKTLIDMVNNGETDKKELGKMLGIKGDDIVKRLIQDNIDLNLELKNLRKG